ncbi:hypothetical protein [Streptomyces sp. adm13(2018)]|uniref:hypothetical protein n=1 Tax=Streptomyces sp. adm13(2018) TaxID=2479007 RepID=UPI0011CD9780|nr:hypothetical protein [Streptomyces sp. adm13(2018)]
MGGDLGADGGPVLAAVLRRLIAELVERDTVHLVEEGPLQVLGGDLQGAGHHGAHDLRHPPHAIVADEGADEEFLGVLVHDDEPGPFKDLEELLQLDGGEAAGLAGPAAEGQVQEAGVVEVGLGDEEQVEALFPLAECEEVGVLPDAGEDPAVATCHGRSAS